MPEVRTVFGHVVDVDDAEAAVLARQGLVATAGDGSDEESAPATLPEVTSSSFTPADYALPGPEPEPGTDDDNEPDADPEATE